MKATELRIGNWFEYNGLFLKVDGIRPPQPLSPKEYADKWLIDCDMSTLTVPLDECKPIPLTEEWLERFGFEQHHNDASFNSVLYIKNIFGNKPKEWGLYPKYLGSGYVVNKSLHLEHVHQLQNLYYALTGEELELKP